VTNSCRRLHEAIRRTDPAIGDARDQAVAKRIINHILIQFENRGVYTSANTLVAVVIMWPTRDSILRVAWLVLDRQRAGEYLYRARTCFDI